MEQTAFELNRGLWREIRPRVGARTQLGITVRWRSPAGSMPRPAYQPRARWSPAPEAPTHPAVLHDLSVSGVRLLLPADDAVVPEAVLEVEVGGEWAFAQVVWLEPSEHPSARWCGLGFVDPEPPFLAAVARVVAERADDHDPLPWEQGGSGRFSA